MKLNCQISLTSRILKREEKRSDHVVQQGPGSRWEKVDLPTDWMPYHSFV